jgi:Na+-driven multidrug efflux pump
MSIAGVALATITSQYLSATLLIITLLRRKGECYALSFDKLRVDKGMLLRILRYGIPASLQSLVFAISNVIITAAINTFPVNTISAKTIAANIEGILYTALNSYSGAAITFVGQNYGAKKRKRINKSIYTAIIQVALFGAVITAITLLLGEPLALMYISEGDPNRNEVLAITLEILYMMTPAYIICGIMETLAGVNRGLGYSIAPMINNLIFTCGVRVLWIYVFFPMPVFASIRGLYLVYPISWILAILAHLVVIIIAQRKLKRMTLNDAVDVS